MPTGMGLVALIRINARRWGNEENRADLDWFTIMTYNLFQERKQNFPNLCRGKI